MNPLTKIGTAIGISIGLATVRKIADMWKGGKADSLIDYTQIGRVEPIVLIDADAMYYEQLGEVQQSLLSIFSGYYLQAVALTTTVGKVDVMRQLDKLNPSRNPVDSGIDTIGSIAGFMLAQESYTHALPMYGQKPSLAMEDISDEEKEQWARDKHQFATNSDEFAKNSDNINFMDYDLKRRNHESDREFKERDAAFKERQANATDAKNSADNAFKNRQADASDAKDRAAAAEAQRNYEHNREKFGHEKAMGLAKQEMEKAGLELNQQKHRDTYSASEMSIGRDTLATIKEMSNLSVGKMLSVEITDGLHKASIPIAIRLMASSIPSASLIHILSHGNKDNSAKERYHAWKSGRISFIRDLCLCQDLIDTHRKNLMADKDSLYANLLKRQRNNQLSTVVSGNPSIATASNLVVMTSETVAQLELRLDGKLSDFHTRERVFKETYIMILVVIDKQWDRVTFYHRGLAFPTQVGIRDLKASNKGSGPDVSDILKAYQFGNAPSL